MCAQIPAPTASLFALYCIVCLASRLKTTFASLEPFSLVLWIFRYFDIHLALLRFIDSCFFLFRLFSRGKQHNTLVRFWFATTQIASFSFSCTLTHLSKTSVSTTCFILFYFFLRPFVLSFHINIITKDKQHFSLPTNCVLSFSTPSIGLFHYL